MTASCVRSLSGHFLRGDGCGVSAVEVGSPILTRTATVREEEHPSWHWAPSSRIDDRTVLVTGQELDFEKGQPDVGNALLHRVEDTLFLVDTGVTTAFREALTRAIDQVGPWHKLVLLTTHGHVDHVGNNDLPDEWAADRGITAEHYVPARDLPQMLEPTRYWESTFDRVVGVAPLPAPPALVADSVVSLFQPLRPFGRTTRSYESLPLERFSIGSQTVHRVEFRRRGRPGHPVTGTLQRARRRVFPGRSPAAPGR